MKNFYNKINKLFLILFVNLVILNQFFFSFSTVLETIDIQKYYEEIRILDLFNICEELDELTAYTVLGNLFFENHGNVIMLINSSNGKIFYANKSAYNYYGYDDLIGKNISDINILSEEEIYKEMNNAEALNKNYFEFQHMLFDGSIRDVEVYSYPIILEEESILFSIIVDVADKKYLEREREHLILRHNKAEEFAGFGHWVFNLNDNSISTSYGAKILYGLSESELAISEVQAYPLPQYREMLDDALYQLVNNSKPYDVKFEIKRSTDNKIIHIHSIAEYDVEKNIVFGIIHDISDQVKAQNQLQNRNRIFFITVVIFLIFQSLVILYLVINNKRIKNLEKEKNEINKQLESSNEELNANNEELESINEELESQYKDLEKLNNELKNANEIKSTFLAKVSHELRTPMNGILGGVQLASKTNSLEEIKEYIDIIENSAERLMPIINDILDISKIENNKFEFDNEEIKILDFLEKSLFVLRAKAKNKGLIFDSKILIGRSVKVKGDKTRIAQIITNLIDNSIKFTEKGYINFKSYYKEIEKDKIKIFFEIEDTGIGIKKNFQENIFKPFEQSEKYITRKYGGTGLGLSIIKEIIKKLDGEISFKSQVGKGTTFYVNIILEKIDN